MAASILDQVNFRSGQTIQLCYHCHKCTSGCPAVSEMMYGPDRLLRMIQTGEVEQLLESRDIWLCASCETCGTRCPNEINIARVMDVLRQMAVTGGCRTRAPNAVKFHRLFLGIIEKLGRTHEAALLALYKFWTLDLFSDLDSGARLIVKGKIPLIPQRIKGRKDVKQLFDVAAAAELEEWTAGSAEISEDEALPDKGYRQ